MNVLAPLENATAVVTGASGFIGSHLVDYLVEGGCTVYALIRKTSDLKWLRQSDRVKLHLADLTQPDLSLPFLDQADYLFHCAGLTKAKTEAEYFKINAEGCTALYENCVSPGKKFKAIVHLSSLAAVGSGEVHKAVDENSPCKPLTFYGKSKLAGEETALKFSSSLPVVIIRPPVVYGPRETDFFTYLKAIQKGWKVKIGHAHRELSLIHVQDLVRAMVEAAVRFPRDENIFFVTDGKAYSWEDVAETAIRILNVRARTLTIPESLVAGVACVSEALAWFGSTAPLIDRQRLIDVCQSSWVASPKRFFDRYNFQPQYDLDKGLRETLAWYQENRWM